MVNVYQTTILNHSQPSFQPPFSTIIVKSSIFFCTIWGRPSVAAWRQRATRFSPRQANLDEHFREALGQGGGPRNRGWWLDWRGRWLTRCLEVWWVDVASLLARELGGLVAWLMWPVYLMIRSKHCIWALGATKRQLLRCSLGRPPAH